MVDSCLQIPPLSLIGNLIQAIPGRADQNLPHTGQRGDLLISASGSLPAQTLGLSEVLLSTFSAHVG